MLNLIMLPYRQILPQKQANQKVLTAQESFPIDDERVEQLEA
jgi:hypothetical protein